MNLENFPYWVGPCFVSKFGNSLNDFKLSANRSIESRWNGIHWVERVEIYQEPSLGSLEPVHGRITTVITFFYRSFWLFFLQYFLLKCVLEFFFWKKRCAIDRACHVLLGTDPCADPFTKNSNLDLRYPTYNSRQSPQKFRIWWISTFIWLFSDDYVSTY